MLRQSSLEQLALKNNHNLLQACTPAVAVGVRCGLLCWCSADTRAAICESKDHTCLISTAAETEALFQVESTRGSGNCARSRGLACLSGYTAKTLNPWSAVGLWIIPAPLHFPPSPCAIHLLSSSSPVNIRGLAELRLSSPHSCTLESTEAGLHTVHLIFYFCYCQRNMHNGFCCCINVLLRFLRFHVFAQLQRKTFFPTD